ncbi:UDP-N-acetylmuramoyl-L-alanine--D-glutamate ligase [Nitrospinota bacterium]
MNGAVLDEVSANWTEKLSSRRAVVMGMARTGRGAAAALARRGVKVVATDVNEDPGLAEGLPPEVALELGGHREETFRGCDLLVVSPGVPATNPFIGMALEGGAEVITEVELASRLTTVPVAAVTGTNGKTTTTAMLRGILEEGGFRAPSGGNIGRPMIEMVEEEGKEADFLVCEVSSFQLEWSPTLRPRVAVMTNVSPDHLDRHPDLSEYADLKARLFANQGPEDAKVVNADDPLAARYFEGGSQQALAFSRREPPPRGAYFDGRDVCLVDGGERQRVCAVDDFAVPGVHNLENFLAACAAAHFLGVDAGAMGRLARRFEGLPHRMEIVGRIGGVTWVNDSKGTNVGATVMSLLSVEGGVLLIAGGTDKGSDLAPLLGPVRDRVRKMFLIGEAAERFAGCFEGVVPVDRAGTLSEAVSRCAKEAREGETVMLSPACSSFDQFRDFEHRGDAFREMARALGKESDS